MDRRLVEKIKDALHVHTSERRGWATVVVLILAAAGWATYEQWFRKPDLSDLGPERKVLDAWLAQRAQADSVEHKALMLFNFDPNDLPVEDWRKLGLSEKQALSIHRYEERGGHFRSKADLRRMRVIRPDLFEEWVPYIQLPDSIDDRSPDREWAERKEPHEQWPRHTSSRWNDDREASPSHIRRLEVNSCDSAQLEALPGIGPSFAKGIIKYRDMLGGYVSLDQLAEVYVLQDKPDAVEKLKTLLVIDTLMVYRISINTCSVEQLAAHPYVKWTLAKPLIAYRQQHGPFKTLEAIQGCAVITPDIYARLAPYLTLQ